MFEILHHFFSPATTSEQWRLNIKDFARGLTMAVISGITEVGYEIAHAEKFVLDWSVVAHAAGVATFAYLVKNFVTPSAAPKT